MTRSGEKDAQRLETLKRRILDIGLIRRGSLIRRFMPCGKPGCRCQASPPHLHGPYYQWTQKVGGKTVTLRVRPTEARLLARWIENGRQLNRLIGELERISHRVTEDLLRAARDAQTFGATRSGRRTPQQPQAPRTGGDGEENR